MRKRLYTAVCALCIALCAAAQVGVESVIDSVQIFIGEQAHLTLTVAMKEGQHAALPSFAPRQYMVPGVEVLEQADGDTVRLSDGTVKVSRRYTLTSFDDTLYYLLAVWQQHALDAHHDELYLVGEIADSKALIERASEFIRRVFTILPSGEFNRSPITQLADVPYDIITLYMKGR